LILRWVTLIMHDQSDDSLQALSKKASYILRVMDQYSLCSGVWKYVGLFMWGIIKNSKKNYDKWPTSSSTLNNNKAFPKIFDLLLIS
jgi:hypothetical protein